MYYILKVIMVWGKNIAWDVHCCCYLLSHFFLFFVETLHLWILFWVTVLRDSMRFAKQFHLSSERFPRISDGPKWIKNWNLFLSIGSYDTCTTVTCISVTILLTEHAVIRTVYTSIVSCIHAIISYSILPSIPKEWQHSMVEIKLW